MKEFNLNNCIYVKLDEKGWEIIRKKDNETKAFILDQGWPYKEAFSNENNFASKTIDGYTEFTMWEFMEIFGSYTNPGFDSQYNMNVIISDKSLIKKPRIKSLTKNFNVK